jgi:hypothetical protein
MVFIATRVAKLSDGQKRGEMATTSKWLNALSIARGGDYVWSRLVCLTAGPGVIKTILFECFRVVCRLTDAGVRSIQELHQDLGNMAADTLHDIEAGVPLLGNYLGK